MHLTMISLGTFDRRCSPLVVVHVLGGVSCGFMQLHAIRIKNDREHSLLVEATCISSLLGDISNGHNKRMDTYERVGTHNDEKVFVALVFPACWLSVGLGWHLAGAYHDKSAGNKLQETSYTKTMTI